MNPLRSFVISEFTNPSGERVFRVSDWLDGKRIRKNFATRAEAEAERKVFEIGRRQYFSRPFKILPRRAIERGFRGEAG
jgi:hypothetical protein